MPTPAQYESLAMGESDQNGFPAEVRALLEHLPGAHRLALVQALTAARAPADPDMLGFLRGRVAGLVESAELRGDLTSDERRQLMLYAVGTDEPAA